MRILGLGLLILGVVVLLFGLNSSQVVADKVVEGVTGRYTSGTMLYIIGGIALMAVGSALAFFCKGCCTK